MKLLIDAATLVMTIQDLTQFQALVIGGLRKTVAWTPGGWYESKVHTTTDKRTA